MDKQIKILLVEPTKYQSLLIERELYHRVCGAVILRARTAAETMRVLRTGDIQIAVVDLDTAAADGIEIIRSLSRADGNVRIVAMASDITEDVARTILESGADELLFKDPSFHLVIPRIINKLQRRGESEVPSGQPDIGTPPVPNSASLGLAAGVLEHEVNNPLMSILGTVELVLEQVTGTDRELTQKMLTIRKSARRIHSVLKRLSTSARTGVDSTARFRLDDQKISQEAVKEAH